VPSGGRAKEGADTEKHHRGKNRSAQKAGTRKRKLGGAELAEQKRKTTHNQGEIRQKRKKGALSSVLRREARVKERKRGKEGLRRGTVESLSQ